MQGRWPRLARVPRRAAVESRPDGHREAAIRQESHGSRIQLLHCDGPAVADFDKSE
jgi:hypothetical protein